VPGLDDVVEGSADRLRRLAKEGQWDALWVHPGAFDVRRVVGQLRHHATRGGHRRDQAEAVYRYGA